MLPVCTILSIIQVKDLPLSFKTAKELCGRAELLPSGPRWQLMVIPTSFPTKLPVVLYWRDPLECIATILNNPLLHGLVDFVPYKEYSLPAMRWRYSEWITGDDAWNMQVGHFISRVISGVNDCHSLSSPGVQHSWGLFFHQTRPIYQP